MPTLTSPGLLLASPGSLSASGSSGRPHPLAGLELRLHPGGACRSRPRLAKRNLSQLTALVKTRLGQTQYRPGRLQGFLASTGLDLAPFL